MHKEDIPILKTQACLQNAIFQLMHYIHIFFSEFSFFKLLTIPDKVNSSACSDSTEMMCIFLSEAGFEYPYQDMDMDTQIHILVSTNNCTNSPKILMHIPNSWTWLSHTCSRWRWWGCRVRRRWTDCWENKETLLPIH